MKPEEVAQRVVDATFIRCADISLGFFWRAPLIFCGGLQFKCWI